MSCASRVTVVIPARDARRFVANAVASALNQTHHAIEVICVDDGSVDGTDRVLASIADPRLRVVTTDGLGVGRARNIGARSGQAEFIAFLDADDEWLPEKLATQLAIFADSPDVVAVGSLMRHESAVGRVLGVTGQCVSDPDQVAIASGRLMPFPISSLLVKRRDFELLGGFDEQLAEDVPGLVEDLDLMARLAARGRVASAGRVLGVYRVHGASASARHFRSQRYGTRFVRARLAARAAGGDLDWQAFSEVFRPSIRQRHGDLVQSWYRACGLNVAEGRPARAAAFGILSVLAGPGYVLRRFTRQQRLRIAR